MRPPSRWLAKLLERHHHSYDQPILFAPAMRLWLDSEIRQNVNHMRLALVPRPSGDVEQLATEVGTAIPRMIAGIDPISADVDQPEIKESHGGQPSAVAWKAHVESWQVRAVATEETAG